MTALLYLSDGTTTVDFLSPTSGIHLNDWKPSLPAWKGGGVWAGSPLSDGRRLTLRNFDNAVDVFDLKVSGSSQDGVIDDAQNLRSLLESAVAYWTGVGNTPVYLAARGPCETYTRFATVIGWKTDQESNAYSQPFFSLLPLDEFSVAIEHGPWLETAPGTSTAVQLSAQQAYNGVTYGRAATTAAEVYFGNRSNLANITHAYYYDAGTVSFSANLIGAALPFAFLPAVPAVGDYVVFGSATAVANSGPFWQVLFDIAAAAAGLTTLTFEVSTGPGTWAAVSATDNTTRFTATGVNAIAFRPFAGTWINAVVNGVDAWWFKVEVTAIGGGPTAPTQRNRNFYATPWSSVDIDDLQVQGDIPALARHIIEYEGASGDIFYRMLLGLRSLSRGANFRQWLNAADEQNLTGVTFATGAGVVIGDSGFSPTGRSATWNPGVAGSTNVYWEFAAALADQYRGRYRLFGRFSMASALTDVYAYAQISDLFGGVNQTTPNAYIQPNSTYFLADFGMVDLPGFYYRPGQDIEFRIYLRLVTGSASPQLTLFDIALLPVDEAAWDFNNATLSTDLLLDADSIGNPREMLIPDLMYVLTPTLKAKSAEWIGSGPLIWQAGADQRLWAIMMSPANYYSAWPSMTAKIHSYRQQRYLSMRGAR